MMNEMMIFMTSEAGPGGSGYRLLTTDPASMIQWTHPHPGLVGVCPQLLSPLFTIEVGPAVFSLVVSGAYCVTESAHTWAVSLRY